MIPPRDLNVNTIDWFEDGPQIVEDQYGSEPSLYDIIRHYYHSSGMTPAQASKCTMEYIDGYKKMMHEKALSVAILN